MRKLVSLLLAFGFWLLAFPAVAFAQTATLSIDPASSTVNQGCGFSFNVLLDTGGASTDGTDAIILYDTSRFTATSITNGTIYPDYPGNNIDAATGKITISGLATCIGGIGPAISEGMAVISALKSIAQQPDASPAITRTLFVGLAMIESIAIYCFVISMILIFANPFWNHFIAK